MNTIMICLNQLGIGGLETAVYNQTIQFVNRGYRVVILAKNGIYRDKFEKVGAIIEEFKFKLKDKYDMDKINEIVKLIDKYKVEQVHIHQFDCICYTYPACVYSKVPYVAYVHTGILGTYDFFDRCFTSYRYLFKLYFESAEKIIAITSQSKQEVIDRYNVSGEKIQIINNSIDFSDFENHNIPNTVKCFAIVSRLAEEKMVSITNGINIFKAYHNKNNDAKLIIVGDGLCRDDVEKSITDIKDYVTFTGQSNDVPSILKNCDVVIGLDRCILEAVAMKKIAIISGYEEIKGIVKPEEIEVLANLNFSGKNVETKSIDSITEELINLSEDDIKLMVDGNYDYARKHLDVRKNIYLISDAQNKKTEINAQNVFDAIVQIQNIMYDNIKNTDKVYQDCKENQKWFEGQIKRLEEENSNLRTNSENLKLQNEELIYKMKNRGIRKVLNKVSRLLNKLRETK